MKHLPKLYVNKIISSTLNMCHRCLRAYLKFDVFFFVLCVYLNWILSAVVFAMFIENELFLRRIIQASKPLWMTRKCSRRIKRNKAELSQFHNVDFFKRINIRIWSLNNSLVQISNISAKCLTVLCGRILNKASSEFPV